MESCQYSVFKNGSWADFWDSVKYASSMKFTFKALMSGKSANCSWKDDIFDSNSTDHSKLLFFCCYKIIRFNILDNNLIMSFQSISFTTLFKKVSLAKFGNNDKVCFIMSVSIVYNNF